MENIKCIGIRGTSIEVKFQEGLTDVLAMNGVLHRVEDDIIVIESYKRDSFCLENFFVDNSNNFLHIISRFFQEELYQNDSVVNILEYGKEDIVTRFNTDYLLCRYLTDLHNHSTDIEMDKFPSIKTLSEVLTTTKGKMFINLLILMVFSEKSEVYSEEAYFSIKGETVHMSFNEVNEELFPIYKRFINKTFTWENYDKAQNEILEMVEKND